MSKGRQVGVGAIKTKAKVEAPFLVRKDSEKTTSEALVYELRQTRKPSPRPGLLGATK